MDEDEDEPKGDLGTLSEMFPGLDIPLLIKIMQRNDWDLLKSTEAALAFTTSLTEEEKHAIEKRKQKLANRNSPRSSPYVFKKISASVASPARRGRVASLGPSFLQVPNVRVTIDRQTDWYMDFTVHFRKLKKSLGMSVKHHGTEIRVHEIDISVDRDDLFLAEKAGIKVNDILTGINSNYLKPGSTVKYVVEQIKRSGDYVTLHFNRRKITINIYDMPVNNGRLKHASSETNHKFAKLLLDQEIIEESMAGKVSQMIQFMKGRAIDWNGGSMIHSVRSKHRPKSSTSFPSVSIKSLIGTDLWTKEPTEKDNTEMSRRNSMSSVSSSSSISNVGPPDDLCDMKGSATGQSSSEDRASGITSTAPSPNTKPKINPISPFDEDIMEIISTTVTSSRKPSMAIGGTGERGSSEPGGNRSFSGSLEGFELPLHEHLRPGLCVRVSGATQLVDHVEYAVWVCDIQSGVEWRYDLQSSRSTISELM